MHKKAISIFFTVLFLGLLSAPSIILVLNDSLDTSIFYSMTEEEEGNGEFKNLLSPFSIHKNDGVNSFYKSNSKSFSYSFKHYQKPHLNLLLPPPETNTYHLL